MQPRGASESNPFLSSAESARYFVVRFAETTRMIASPDGPIFNVATITGSDSRMLMSVDIPVFS